MSKTKKEIVRPKSVIRYVWVAMREAGAEKLSDKKKVFEQVLSESSIKPWTAKYMINKVQKMRTHQEFDSYLINSKNYFEKNFEVVPVEG